MGDARTIVIAGSSSGIGAAALDVLYSAGHRIFACARRLDRLQQLAAGKSRVLTRMCDVGDEHQVQEFAAWVTEHTDHVDTLLNCAGAFGPIGPFADVEATAWFEAQRVNVFGTFLMSQRLLPLLRKSNDARILNFAGGGAFDAFQRYSAYACSKAAVVRLTECMAAELASDNIAVNAIAPGFVPTEIHLATLAAGDGLAGSEHFERTRTLLNDAPSGNRLGTALTCIQALLSPDLRGLTGRTISANFDPWMTDIFHDAIPEIVSSDLYTMRRINIVNLPEGSLRSAMTRAKELRPESDR